MRSPRIPPTSHRASRHMPLVRSTERGGRRSPAGCGVPGTLRPGVRPPDTGWRRAASAVRSGRRRDGGHLGRRRVHLRGCRPPRERRRPPCRRGGAVGSLAGQGGAAGGPGGHVHAVDGVDVDPGGVRQGGQPIGGAPFTPFVRRGDKPYLRPGGRVGREAGGARRRRRTPCPRTRFRRRGRRGGARSKVTRTPSGVSVREARESPKRYAVAAGRHGPGAGRSAPSPRRRTPA